MKTRFSKAESGFTLIELMITIAIIGILAAIAIPSYISYTLKAQFSETIQAADVLRSAVGVCAQRLGTVTGCTNGANGIPAAQGAVGNVASVATANGVITATSQNLSTNYTYILTPTRDATTGVITWATGGTCVAAGVC